MNLIRLTCSTPDPILRRIEAFYDDDARCYSNDRPDQYADIRSWACAVTGLAARDVWYAQRPEIANSQRDIVGLGGLRYHDEPDCAELFVVVDPRQRDRGIGTEIVRLVIEEGHRRYHRIEARADVENTRGLSCLLAAGMHLEGVQRGLLHERPGGITTNRDYALLSHLRDD
jgi:RimJ/RimL family protein N-acetyltransferase